jgi:hypothetical protein
MRPPFPCVRILTCFTLLAAAPAAAQTEASGKTIQQFVEISGGSASFDATIGQWAQLATRQVRAFVSQQMKNTGQPDAPEAVYSRFEEEFAREMRNRKQTLIEALYPVYRKHFSEEELLQLIEFYRSPLGRKLSARSPLLMQEAMQTGAQWGDRNSTEIVQQVLGRMDLPSLLRQR